MREELRSSPKPAWSRSYLRSRATLRTASCSSSHLGFLKHLGLLIRHSLGAIIPLPTIRTFLLHFRVIVNEGLFQPFIEFRLMGRQVGGLSGINRQIV